MGPTFTYQDSMPFSTLTSHGALIIILLVVSWIGLVTWRKKLEALKLDVELAVVDPVRQDIDFQIVI